MATESNDHGKDIKMIGREERVRIAPLEVDYTYQRCVKPYHKKMAREWDPEAAGVLVVGRRPCGRLMLIDGQQRREAMLLLGITEWRALVLRTSGPDHEARIYNIYNGGAGTRRPQTTREQFKAQLAARDPLALRVKEITDEFGLKIADTAHVTAWPYVACIKTLYERAYPGGDQILRETLRVITVAWPQNGRAFDATIVSTVWSMLYHYPQTDAKRLAERLQDADPLALLQASRTLGIRGLIGTMYGLIAKRYNYKLHSRKKLPLELPKGGPQTCKAAAGKKTRAKPAEPADGAEGE